MRPRKNDQKIISQNFQNHGTVNFGGTVDVNATLTNNNTVNVPGIANISATFSNSGTAIVLKGDQIKNTGIINSQAGGNIQNYRTIKKG